MTLLLHLDHFELRYKFGEGLTSAFRPDNHTVSPSDVEMCRVAIVPDEVAVVCNALGPNSLGEKPPHIACASLQERLAIFECQVIFVNGCMGKLR